MNILRWVEWLRQDIPYAARLCRRRPAFAVSAVVSLALAIGANALVFSVLNALVVRPLPVESPEQLVFVQSSLASIVYRAAPREPVVMAAGAIVLVGVGLASCWAPLRRSLRIEPMSAVRSD